MAVTVTESKIHTSTHESSPSTGSSLMFDVFSIVHCLEKIVQQEKDVESARFVANGTYSLPKNKASRLLFRKWVGPMLRLDMHRFFFFPFEAHNHLRSYVLLMVYLSPKNVFLSKLRVQLDEQTHGLLL